MNNKYILTALCATALSGINLLAMNGSLPETPPAPNQKIKTFKEIANKEVKKHCRENNTELCQELLKLLAITDNIESDEIKTTVGKILEEIKIDTAKLNNTLGNMASHAEQKVIEKFEEIKENVVQ